MRHFQDIFDGESRSIRINDHATIHHDNITVNNHYGAKFVVRIKCEIFQTARVTYQI
jgi:hypothetical protein